MFVSVDGKSKKVTDIFAGGQDGKAHRITELFGSVNGVAKRLFTTETTTNAFDQFTWAEIKQLANDGKLLEHFNLFDRVTIKFKEPLTNDLKFYMTGYGVTETCPQTQGSMMFQIVELTESKMRLMCPRVNVLGSASSSIVTSVLSDKTSKWYQYGSDFYNNTGSARTYATSAWGLGSMYTALKTIENAFPDDFRDVLSVLERPMTYYGRHPISKAVEMEFDEDMRITQVSDDILSKSIDTTDDDCFYPIINKSYYSTSIGEYLSYIRLPEQYDTPEQRKYIVNSYYKGLTFLDHSRSGTSIYVSYTTAPYASCYFTKGITTNADYNNYLAAGKVTKEIQGRVSGVGTIFPEVVIQAD